MTFENIKELIKLFSESNIANLKIKEGDVSISLDKESKTKNTTTVEQLKEEVKTEVVENSVESNPVNKVSTNNTFIKSPMVGTFYKSPSPDSPSFVEVGDVVRKGQKICILEAMKIMNELEAEFDCKIVKILVENTSAVEYDMPLFEVEKL